MKRTFLLGCLVLGVVIASAAFAEDAKKPSVEEQLNQIIALQHSIEQRLTALEAKQMTIINAFGAFGNALRPMPAGAGSGCGGGAPGAAQGAPVMEDLNKVYKIDLGHSSLKGNKNAKVTIVEFSDFQCPFSQRFHSIVNEVLKMYPNDVNYIFKNFPLQFHPMARPAAKASLAAREQGKYWEMVEALFDSKGNLGDDHIKELAQNLGLNVDKFMKDYKERDAEWEKLLQEDMTTAMSVGVRGTPTFFINGKQTRARDVQSYKTEIDAILKGSVKK